MAAAGPVAGSQTVLTLECGICQKALGQVTTGKRHPSVTSFSALPAECQGSWTRDPGSVVRRLAQLLALDDTNVKCGHSGPSGTWRTGSVDTM